jgi:HD-GYP domain-containing protein (c-di-GMP phosphodiesterase class II)
MEYVKIKELRQGMIIAASLYDPWGRTVAVDGTSLTDKLIKQLRKRKFEGAYVDDISLYKQTDLANLLSNCFSTKDRIITNLVSKESELFLSYLEKLNTLSTEAIEEILNGNITVLDIENLKRHNSYTYTHSVSVATISTILGVGLGLPSEYLKELYVAGVLHDIGKLFISNDILDKPGPLTSQEFKEIQSHSTKGYDLLKLDKDLNDRVTKAVLHHHENYNGTGYPSKLVKESIPLYSSIIHIADVFDALSSDRCYHKAYTKSYAYNYILNNSNTLFNPEIVDVFKRRISPYTKGSIVLLSDGRTGIVQQIDINSFCSPVVKILEDGNIINLKDSNIIIKEEYYAGHI